MTEQPRNALPSSPSTPIWQVQHGVGTLTLNRPAHRNRLHDEDLRVILKTCDAVRADPSVRALILTARTGPSTPVFSAGYHIGEFGHNGAAPMPFEHVPDALAAVARAHHLRAQRQCVWRRH